MKINKIITALFTFGVFFSVLIIHTVEGEGNFSISGIPSVKIISPQNNSTYGISSFNGNIIIEWNVDNVTDDDFNFQIRIDNEYFTLGNETLYTLEPEINASFSKEYIISVCVINETINISSDQISVSIDLIDPICYFTDPYVISRYYGVKVNKSRYQIKWTGDGTGSEIVSYKLEKDGQVIYEGINRSFEIELNATHSNVIQLTCYDEADNYFQLPFWMTFDNRSPAIRNYHNQFQLVPVNYPFKLKFSEDMDEENITTSLENFEFEYTWILHRTVVITPKTEYDKGTNYSFVVIAQDLAGNSITSNPITFETFTDDRPYGLLTLIVRDNRYRIQGANVEILNDSRQLSTDRMGELEEFLLLGNYTLLIYKEGYENIIREVQINSSNEGDFFLFFLDKDEDYETNDDDSGEDNSNTSNKKFRIIVAIICSIILLILISVLLTISFKMQKNTSEE